MSSANNKLHPIYVALDGHQYSRAIKLASALPPTNTLGQALLAVALQKSGQKYKCLQTLLTVLGSKNYYELERALEKCSEHYEKKQPAAAAAAPAQTTKSKGKKSKKKSAPVATVPKEAPVQEIDWIQQLEQTPTVPEGWDEVASDGPAIITDETILGTLALPLQAMRLYVTIYQMYSRASSAAKGDELADALAKNFHFGLRLVLDPSFDQKLQLLGSMQVSALQLARLVPSNTLLFTKWAAQTAIWQLDFLSKSDSIDDDDKTRQRQAMLPRLAESLAHKAVQQQEGAEDCLLYLATLKNQNKTQEELEFLTNLLNKESKQQQQQQQVLSLSKGQVLEKQAQVLMDLKLYEKAGTVYDSLVREHNDQWSYWLGCLEAFHNENDETCLPRMYALVEEVMEESCKEKHVPRGPYLMKVELAAVRIRGVKAKGGPVSATGGDLDRLQNAIVEYATYWAPRASCAFSDLEPYVELLVQSSKDAALQFLEWSETMQQESSIVALSDTTDTKEQRSQLRRYICAVKLAYRIVELLNDQNGRLPNWTNLVKEWQAATSWTTTDDSAAEDEVQKESQPGDELMLVAVKRLLQDDPNDKLPLTRAATCLEMAMRYSPYNPHLCISAMHVYAQLNAASRSYELYQQLYVKHVQLDSCSYLILPMLVEGGLYQQALEESSSILKLHATTFKDTGDFTGRAMESGTLSKANEFLEWQQRRMNNSLAVLEAKGRIMDCAPLVTMQASNKKSKGDNDARPLAVQHGIIGGDADMERAINMTKEAHNHLGAPSIVSLVNRTADEYSDNRDLTILAHQMMQPISTCSKERIVCDSIRSGHVHGLLVRAALCVDVCKGPKKGKVQKPTQELEKRCASLIAAAIAASDFIDSNTETLAPAYPDLLQALLSLCRVLVVVSAGISLDNDSLSERERHVAEQLLPLATSQVESARTMLSSKASVATVCQLLPDCLVAVFALLEMNSNIFATFGWGKRKRRTKSAAGGLADFALALRGLIMELRDVFASLPTDTEQEKIQIMEIVKSLATHVEEASVDKDRVHDMASHIVRGQRATREGVAPYLEYILNMLNTFDVSDNS